METKASVLHSPQRSSVLPLVRCSHLTRVAQGPRGGGLCPSLCPSSLSQPAALAPEGPGRGRGMNSEGSDLAAAGGSPVQVVPARRRPVHSRRRLKGSSVL